MHLRSRTILAPTDGDGESVPVAWSSGDSTKFGIGSSRFPCGPR
jgi:hypothetical protein